MDLSSRETGGVEDHESEAPTPAVVLDTVGFIRTLLKPIATRGEIIFDHRDLYELIVSDQLLAEIADVLQRPQLTRKYSVLAGRNVQAVEQRLAAGRHVTLRTIE